MLQRFIHESYHSDGGFSQDEETFSVILWRFSQKKKIFQPWFDLLELVYSAEDNCHEDLLYVSELLQ